MSRLSEIISSSENIVFFGGAGVSTESGIPDYRSVDGLYNQKYDYPPETMLSSDFFYENTEEFYKFYKDKMICTDALPNDAHKALAKLEQMGKLKAVVTQNIDNLHQMAGSKTVYELHGSAYRNYCTKCHKAYGVDKILSSDGVPKCECGGVIKPDVVLYGEGLDNSVVFRAISAIRKAEVLIIGGTSLSVYPAASFIEYFGGSELVLINKTPTDKDRLCTHVVHDSIGKVLKSALEEM